MKFLVPNYSCLQNSWLGGYRPQIPVLSVLCPQLNLLNPSEKNSWVRHWWQQRISTKKFPLVWPSEATSFRRTLSWQRSGWKSSARVVPTATTRILRRRFPGSCETVGQVFKFVWRLRWKLNVVCMSLSPFVSFQSLFVTYLLTSPRTNPIILIQTNL